MSKYYHHVSFLVESEEPKIDPATFDRSKAAMTSKGMMAQPIFDALTTDTGLCLARLMCDLHCKAEAERVEADAQAQRMGLVLA